MPLPGVSIQVEGTDQGVITDFDGNYTIENVDPQSTLVFSYLGFQTRRIPIDNRNEIDVVLASDAQALDEVILTGYTTQRRSDIAGAISVVETDELAQESSPNVLTALQGRVAGINIQSDGTPGGNNSEVVIRGVTSINSGTGPLYVVDGIQTYNLSSINPDEIESMQVLKDGASAAIYGTRGANGVIIITTKRAKEGKLTTSFKALVGVQTLRDKIDVLSARQWADVKYASYQGNIPSELPPYLIDEGNRFSFGEYLEVEQLQRTSDTDWVDVIYDPAFFQQYDFSISAGSEKFTSYFSLNYFEDNGVQKYTEYERINARLNSNYTPVDWLNISENLLISNFSEVQANNLSDAALQNPLIPLYDNEGNYGGPVEGLQDRNNPLGLLWANQDNRNKYWRILGGLTATVNITDDLAYNSIVALDFNNQNFRGRQREFIQAGYGINQNEVTPITQSNNLFIRTQFTNFLTYSKSLNEHAFEVLAGVEQVLEKEEYFFGRTVGVPDNSPDNMYLSAGQGNQSNGSAQRKYRLSSQFGQLKYTYADRYLLSGTLRRDGSSRFGPNNRFALFPSASFAWKVLNEPFMVDQETFSDLKFRASYAISGNDQIGEGRFRTRYGLQSESSEYGNYDIDGDGTGAATGIIVTAQGNPDITWEETEQYNIGLDLGLMDNKLYFSVDYYNKLTSNLLVAPAQPATSGQGAPPFSNSGEVSNQGVELAVNFSNYTENDFFYEINLTAARNINNVDNLFREGREFFNAVGIARVGSPIGAFYGYETAGLFNSLEEIEQHPDQTSINGRAPRLGGIKYVDINGDGVVDTEDRTIIGNPYPDLNLGLNLNMEYQNFDLTLFFDGKFGHDLFNDTRKSLDFVQFDFNHGLNTLDAWTPENRDTSIPSLTRDNYNETVNSSYFVEKGDYFRLKNITLGYNFSSDAAETIGLTNLRVFIQSQNLFTLTSYSGFDYETPGASFGSNIGFAGFTVPHTKSFSLGVNLDF